MVCWASSMVIMGLGHHQLLASTNMLLSAESIFLSDSSDCCAKSFRDFRHILLHLIPLSRISILGRRFAALPLGRDASLMGILTVWPFEADSLLTAVDRTNGAHTNLVTAGQLTQGVTLDYPMSLYLTVSDFDDLKNRNVAVHLVSRDDLGCLVWADQDCARLIEVLRCVDPKDHAPLEWQAWVGPFHIAKDPVDTLKNAAISISDRWRLTGK